jgi:putative spermidine/putrescine transport system permease protein
MSAAGNRSAHRGAWRPFLLLLPAVLVVLVLFLGGWMIAFMQSLGYFSPVGDAFTLAHYQRLFTDRELRASLQFTLATASAATFFSSVGGVALALGVHRFARHSQLLRSALQVPLSTPHLAAAVILIHVISPSGLIARVAYASGLIAQPSDFPGLVADSYGVGVTLAYALKEAPFVALMVLAVLARVGDEYVQVARNLGANAWRTFYHVTLPLIAPSVVFSSLIVFAFVFGAFEIPFVLGRTFPAALAVVAQRRFSDVDLDERPSAMALVIVMSLLAAALAWLHLRLSQKIFGSERPTIF